MEFFQTAVLVLIEFENHILIVFVLIEIYRHDRKHDSIWLKYALILKTFYPIYSFSIKFFQQGCYFSKYNLLSQQIKR